MTSVVPKSAKSDRALAPQEHFLLDGCCFDRDPLRAVKPPSTSKDLHPARIIAFKNLARFADYFRQIDTLVSD
jgi:hypothetical protein